MESVALVVLAAVGDAFAAALAGNVTDATLAKLRAEPARAAFAQAMSQAIHRYATGGVRLSLARPLLAEDGLLTNPAVAAELTQLVRFERPPAAVVIGRHWRSALANPWPSIDFTAEAESFLRELRLALRGTEPFRPVFDSMSLDAIALRTSEASEASVLAAQRLAELTALMDAGFLRLSEAIAASAPSIHQDVRDFSRLLEEKTRGFVGRQFVFDAIDSFLADFPHGYFIVRGEPGIGKTALAAQYVKTRGLVHHFNVQGEGITRTDAFLRSVCAQIVAAYHLDYASLPADAGQDAGFLNRLLGEAAAQLATGERIVLVVDALDEADSCGNVTASNVLHLPSSLPPGVFVVATTRPIALNLRVECIRRPLDLEEDLAGNIADILAYIEQAIERPGIRTYIENRGMSPSEFVETLQQLSQGNFMYLQHVLPEIEHGAYEHVDLSMLPEGLKNYYDDHWRRMRGKDEQAWFEYKLPVIAALTEVTQPVPIDYIPAFSGVDSRARIQAVLDEWAPFLHKETAVSERGVESRYRLYHASFHDFISALDQVKAERVDLAGARVRIARAAYNWAYPPHE